MNKMTWRDLLTYLVKLDLEGDKRLDDTVVVYDCRTNDAFPCDTASFDESKSSECMLNDNQLLLVLFDWNGKPLC